MKYDENSNEKYVRPIKIDKLNEAHKKTSDMPDVKLLSDSSQEGLEVHFLNTLLKPKNWSPPQDNSFPFKPEFIIALCDLAENVISQQSMVVRLRAPVKIFGDIHGQYIDLMRFFDLYGAPLEDGGDIESFDYLFLGDYVDRGTHSLETVCLLFALKVK